jgi:hypothetical protein
VLVLTHDSVIRKRTEGASLFSHQGQATNRQNDTRKATGFSRICLDTSSCASCSRSPSLKDYL